MLPRRISYSFTDFRVFGWGSEEGEYVSTIMACYPPLFLLFPPSLMSFVNYDDLTLGLLDGYTKKSLPTADESMNGKKLLNYFNNRQITNRDPEPDDLRAYTCTF